MKRQSYINYLKEIKKLYLSNDCTESSYRTSFENFVKSLNENYDLTQEPKRVANLGAPDFKALYRGRKIGFVETKNIDKNLDEVLKTEQLRRYIEGIDNLLLTNYSRFILIQKGQKICDCSLFSTFDLEQGVPVTSEDKIEAFQILIEKFFNYKMPVIKTAEELARELAKRTKVLKKFVKEQLLSDLGKVKNNERPSPIYDFHQGIKKLIKDITVDDIADAYVQIVVYSLFMAKKTCKGKLSIETAFQHIPENVGIIKRIFLNISAGNFPTDIQWVIDSVVDLLNAADIDSILTKIDVRGKKDKDPIIFFYEDFLNYYEPDDRRQYGVYYTPRPVVNFIVNSVHSILKKYFNKPLGLADKDINVLDPAAGTGTFFWLAYLVVLNELKKQGLKGLIPSKIKNHLLKHFYGFEILITPYVIAHLKLTDLLQRWGYRFDKEDRVQVYLTNTLEPHETQEHLPFLREIVEENKVANQIKLKEPVLVIMGNPPYNVNSHNKSDWIINLLKEGYTRADGSKDDGYYKVNGEPLGEKQCRSLQDDYVKFIRYAQWKIDQNGEGIVAFITNHSYLDNITFRGMRESLLQSFNRIFILNLHGNALRQERCPDGSKDENVFDIKQGVAISIFIKHKDLKGNKVYYADLWGRREDKYHSLDRRTADNIEWQEVEPKPPYYFFVPRDTSFEEEYDAFVKVVSTIQAKNIGVETGRDRLTIQYTSEEVWKVINRFVKLDPEEARRVYDLPKDTRDWKIIWAQEDIKNSKLDKSKIITILYRPLDIRYTYYTEKVRGFYKYPRRKIMKNLLKENIALILKRQVRSGKIWNHCFVTNTLVDRDVLGSASYVFPLYIYTDSGEKKPNLNPEFVNSLKQKYNTELTPEEIFYYMYAVLHSSTYRRKYNEFLKRDFPRIPFVDDYKLFKKLVKLGERLVELHLMKKKLPIETKFDVEGSNIIEKVKYEGGRIWINDAQYFDRVPEEAWNFYIGNYQVLKTWLKSRKGRVLSEADIEHFLQVVEVIKETIRIMDEIEKIQIC